MATNKNGSCNPMQKGERRRILHEQQNNVGNPKNKSQYKNFNGEPIE
ncbi:MAG: clostri-philic family protein [Clostridium sp.]